MNGGGMPATGNRMVRIIMGSGSIAPAAFADM